MTNRDIWAAILAYIKTQTSVTSLLNAAGDVKERQWQGVDFVYPAIRLSLNFYPSINGCGPDRAEVFLQAFSEEKSSDETQLITSALEVLLHKKPFTSNGIKFPVVVVKEVSRPQRGIFAWESTVDLTMQMYNSV